MEDRLCSAIKEKHRETLPRLRGSKANPAKSTSSTSGTRLREVWGGFCVDIVIQEVSPTLKNIMQCMTTRAVEGRTASYLAFEVTYDSEPI